jgi:hypothetical protein
LDINATTTAAAGSYDNQEKSKAYTKPFNISLFVRFHHVSHAVFSAYELNIILEQKKGKKQYKLSSLSIALSFVSFNKNILFVTIFLLHTLLMRKERFKYVLNLLLLLLILGSCAYQSRPNLFPNDVLKERGPEKSKADIDQCLNDAEVYFNSPEGKKVAHGGTTTTSVGLGIGLGGDGFGLGAGVGTGNVVSGTDVKKGYVNQCLENKGYQVLVWE